MGEENVTMAQAIVEMATDLELFHNCDAKPYATIKIQEHEETWPLRSEDFNLWISNQYFKSYGTLPKKQALEDALLILEGNARFVGPQIETYLRVAGDDSQIIIDLGNSKWEQVVIDQQGWYVSDKQKVKFNRPSGTQPLPYPVEGGSLNELRDLINLKSENDWCLLLSWLMTAFRPDGPYLVLCLEGEQGTGKSTVTRLLTQLIDPKTASLRALPKDERDLAVMAANNWLLSIDNVSFVRNFMLDAFCGVATGRSFSTRRLYSDATEQFFTYKRPLLFNGISELGTRSDFASRAIQITLPYIDQGARVTERELYRLFDEKKGRIFGSLLSCLSAAIKNIGATRLLTQSRMIDALQWASSSEEQMGFESGFVIKAYELNKNNQNSLIIENSSIAEGIISLARENWDGTASELLEKLQFLTDDGKLKRKDFPYSPQTLSVALRRLAPNLRATGIEVTFYKTGGSRSERRISLKGLRESNTTVGVDGDARVTSEVSLESQKDKGNNTNFRVPVRREHCFGERHKYNRIPDCRGCVCSFECRDAVNQEGGL